MAANNLYYVSMTVISLWELRSQNPWSKWSPSAREQRAHDEYLARGGGSELKALLWIRENAAQYATLSLVRLRTELGPDTGQILPRNRLISTVVWLVVFPTGLYRLWRPRREPTARLILLLALAVIELDSLFLEEGCLRYRMPVDLALTLRSGFSFRFAFRPLQHQS